MAIVSCCCCVGDALYGVLWEADGDRRERLEFLHVVCAASHKVPPIKKASRSFSCNNSLPRKRNARAKWGKLPRRKRWRNYG